MIPNFTYIQPDTIEEAVKHLDGPDALVHAGGTDLLTCLRDRVFGASKLVSLSRLKKLRGIEETADGSVRIGALATVTEVAENPLIRERYRALAQGASEVASPQLRHQGTIGGNLCQKPRCWYYRGEFHCLRKGGARCFAVNGENQFHCIFGGHGCFIVHPSDTAPALVAFNAGVRIAGPKGSRTVPVAEFHLPPARDPTRETVLEPGEIVTEIILPPPAKGSSSSYRKVRARGAWDFALAGVALAVEMNGRKVKNCRVVLSGAAPVPWVSGEAEQAIIGRELNEEVISRAAAEAVKNAEPMSRNGFKIRLFQGMIAEELEKIMAG